METAKSFGWHKTRRSPQAKTETRGDLGEMEFIQVMDRRNEKEGEPTLINLEQIIKIPTKPDSFYERYTILHANGCIVVDRKDMERIKQYIPVVS